MLASALVPAYAIAVLMPAGPDDGCPSPRQVTEALDAHLPGIVAPLGQPIPAETLRLAVATEPSGATRLDLTDVGGDLLLRRQLPLAARGRGGDCPALAETVALIVERYWREIGSDVRPVRPTAPPPPEPPPPQGAMPASPAPATGSRSDPTGDTLAVPGEGTEATGQAALAAREQAAPPPSGRRARLAVGAAMAARGGETGDLDASAALAFSAEVPIGRGRLGLRLSAGVSNSRDVDGGAGSVGFRHLPARVGAYLPIPLRIGQLEPGAGLVVDWISIRVTDAGAAGPQLAGGGLCSGQLCASPGGDLALGWSARLTRHLYIRALSRLALVAPYRFATDSGGTLWGSPRAYLELGLEWGVWF